MRAHHLPDVSFDALAAEDERLRAALATGALELPGIPNLMARLYAIESAKNVRDMGGL